MQKAEVAGAPKAFGQHMLQNQPQEFWPRQRSGLHLFGFAVLVAKSHQTIPASHNILFLDHALIKIPPQIDQRLVAAADGLDIYYPSLRDRNLLLLFLNSPPPCGS
jgi:hypothetical protein